MLWSEHSRPSLEHGLRVQLGAQLEARPLDGCESSMRIIQATWT